MRYFIFAKVILDGAIAVAAAVNHKFAVAWMFTAFAIADAAAMYL